jgi:hypothetical protein
MSDEQKPEDPAGPRGAREVRLQIQLDDDLAQGSYSNLAMVNHTETEFVLDFIYVQPQRNRAKVRARILSSPVHTKRLAAALMDNVAKYEARYGPIKMGPAMPVPDDALMH